MKNITRREFLTRMLFSIASSMSVSSFVYAGSQVKTGNVQHKRSLALEECAAVYAEWSGKEKIKPVHYFVDAMEKYGLKPWQISDAAKQDFKLHNFFEINGLQLSKTEAAFLALIGAGTNT
ncbi:hypothetical protein ACFL2V_01735 [Pseudomonadota bacterium]